MDGCRQTLGAAWRWTKPRESWNPAAASLCAAADASLCTDTGWTEHWRLTHSSSQGTSSPVSGHRSTVSGEARDSSVIRQKTQGCSSGETACRHLKQRAGSALAPGGLTWLWPERAGATPEGERSRVWSHHRYWRVLTLPPDSISRPPNGTCCTAIADHTALYFPSNEAGQSLPSPPFPICTFSLSATQEQLYRSIN